MSLCNKSGVRSFFKKFDYFGVQFSFNFKTEKKYYSSAGGVCFFIFLFITISYIILNAIPLLKRNKKTIISYHSELSQTDVISFLKYSSSFAINLKCDIYKIEDYLSLKLNHVHSGQKDGQFKKSKVPINLRPCTEADFYNDFNTSYHDMGLSTYLCPEYKNYSLRGAYTDEDFEYYEVVLKAVDANDKQIFNKIRDILYEDECHLSFLYIETSINLDNYYHPAERTIKSVFTTLHYQDIVKMNIFFEALKFKTYNNYIFDFCHTSYYASFSSIETYTVEKGDSRFEKKPVDYELFSKMYIRAATSRSLIERHYMKLTEFAANMTSMLYQALLFLYFIISYINSFYAEVSIIKDIFRLREEGQSKKKDIEQNFIKNLNTLKALESSKKNYVTTIKKNFTVKSNQSPKRQNLTKLNASISQTNPHNISNTNLKQNNYFCVDNGDVSNSGTGGNLASQVLEDGIQNSTINSKIMQKGALKLCNKTKKNKFFRFNIFEVIIAMFFPRLLWRSLKNRIMLYFKARNKLIQYLDVVSFLKNMQLLQLLNYTTLNTHEYNIVNFLSKPSLSLSSEDDILDLKKIDKESMISSLKYLKAKKQKTPSEKRVYLLAKGEINKISNTS